MFNLRSVSSTEFPIPNVNGRTLVRSCTNRHVQFLHMIDKKVASFFLRFIGTGEWALSQILTAVVGVSSELDLLKHFVSVLHRNSFEQSVTRHCLRFFFQFLVRSLKACLTHPPQDLFGQRLTVWATNKTANSLYMLPKCPCRAPGGTISRARRKLVMAPAESKFEQNIAPHAHW